MSVRVVVVIMVLVVRATPRHVVSRERRKMATRRVKAVGIVGVMPVRVGDGHQGVPLDLVRSLCEHRDVHACGTLGVAAAIGAQAGGVRDCISRIRVRRRHVGRGESRCRSRSNVLGGRRRRHHVTRLHGSGEHGVRLLALVASSRVGVIVYPRVPGQLIGSRELLAAARELAGMGLLSGVGANVPSLMLQAVEGLVAERALVGPRELVGGICGLLVAGKRTPGSVDGDGSHVDVSVVVCLLLLLRLLPCQLRLVCSVSLRCVLVGIQQIGKIHCRLCSLHVIAFPRGMCRAEWRCFCACASTVAAVKVQRFFKTCSGCHPLDPSPYYSF